MSFAPRRRNSRPLPSDYLGQRLCQIFSYPWRAIVRANQPDSNWETITKHAIDPRELWLRWQDADQIVGVRFGSSTLYGMIDLDVSSIYHPYQDAEALRLIQASLETIGITRTFLTQSSFSGGLHLWLPLPEEVPTFWLGAAIKQCLETQGFTVKQGQLEVFPNCKAFARPGQFTEYQGHRLPLQPETGAQILDNGLNPMTGELDRFFSWWDQCANGQDTDLLRQAITQAEHNKKQFRRRNSSVVDSWRNALEFDISEGWTDHGQTNHLLKQIACYGVVFIGLKGEALIEYVQRIATNCSGYEQWCRHQHEIALRCAVWARAAEGYYWALGTEGIRRGEIHKLEGANSIVRLHRVNQARSEDAQARITAAYEQLKSEGRLPGGKTARENLIVQEARCSKQTTRKYLHLWYPEQDNLQPVCTPDVETGSNEFGSASIKPPESLESLPNDKVHTVPLMKGLTTPRVAWSNTFQISLPLGDFLEPRSTSSSRLSLGSVDCLPSVVDLNFQLSNELEKIERFRGDELLPDG